ncbi:MAG TPA: hypothetical protein VF950_22240 [Planctomycetota bacterium]
MGMLLALLLAQDAKPADKIGKDKPPAAAAKALAEARKRKSAAIKESNQIGAQAAAAAQFDGVMRGDFAAVKGAMELYARGAVVLVNTGGRFDPPEELKGQEALQALTFRHPALYLADVGKVVASATFGGDEVVDGKDCRVVDLIADAPLIKQYLKDLGDRVEKAMAGQGGGPGLFGAGGVFRLANAFDEKGTVATFRLCVGKDDLLPYKFEFVMRPKIKPGSLPPEIKLPPLDQKTEILFSKWDQEVPFDIAGFIKAKWGVK